MQSTCSPTKKPERQEHARLFINRINPSTVYDPRLYAPLGGASFPFRTWHIEQAFDLIILYFKRIPLKVLLCSYGILD